MQAVRALRWQGLFLSNISYAKVTSEPNYRISFISLTVIGRVTAGLLQVNRRERVEERGLLVRAKVLYVPE
jgi:hypothetical protein